MIPDDDRGLLLGDGLFETLLAENGQLRLFDRHMARMIRGCGFLGLAPPGADKAHALAQEAMAEAGLSKGRAAVRLTLTAGSGRGLDRPGDARPRLFASASAAPVTSSSARLNTVAIRRNDASPVSRLKTLSYLDNVLARREAKDAGGDEALLLNTRDEIACAAAANIFWMLEGRLCTPALECGVLDGIMRGRVLEETQALGVEVCEVRTGIQALRDAQAVFLTNSLIGVRAVAVLDGRPVAEHPLVRSLDNRCTRPGSTA